MTPIDAMNLFEQGLATNSRPARCDVTKFASWLAANRQILSDSDVALLVSVGSEVLRQEEDLAWHEREVIWNKSVERNNLRHGTSH